MADVFEDDLTCTTCPSDTDLGTKEWSQVTHARFKEGYREGVSAGQDLTLQKGFNQGYTLGFQKCFRLAQYRGVLCAFLGEKKRLASESDPQEILNSVEDLIVQLSVLEQTILQGIASNDKKESNETESCERDSDSESSILQGCEKEDCCKAQSGSIGDTESTGVKSGCSESRIIYSDNYRTLEREVIDIIKRLELKDLLNSS